MLYMLLFKAISQLITRNDEIEFKSGDFSEISQIKVSQSVADKIDIMHLISTFSIV